MEGKVDLHKKMHSWYDILSVILAPILGFIFIVLPPYLIPGGIRAKSNAPLFPVIATAIENLKFFPTIVSLLIAGCILGFLRPHIWWILGLLTMSLFPIAAILEMQVAPTSHNLWPFEFISYGVFDFIAFVGAFIGSRIKTKLMSKK
jgi:hypothetical protein